MSSLREIGFFSTCVIAFKYIMTLGNGLTGSRNALDAKALGDPLRLFLRLAPCCQALNLRQVIQIMAGERFQLHA